MDKAKCEGCGREQEYDQWPRGWVQTGASRYENQYDPNGIAWWCPKCRKKLEKKEQEVSR